ncbi:lectin [Neisseria zalophi]|uniref:1,4-beta-xylanase n=1 Tax=Neisseria zalophi TaxID=640030 RepID=A0A5J6PZW1_9NEIS|nr:lectin [Neisseria zalophi]QEY26210.1 1,4-beta-xylanase [Neisseria zalophi]
MNLNKALFLLPVLLTGCIYIGDTDSIPETHEHPRGQPAPKRHPRIHYPSENTRTFRIQNVDGKCLDLSGANGKDIISYNCHGQSNQRFTFKNNSLRVNGLCLDIAEAERRDGAPVIAYACHGGDNQKWYRDGETIRSALNGKCLDTGKGGNRVRMYRCDGSRGQRFRVSYR